MFVRFALLNSNSQQKPGNTHRRFDHDDHAPPKKKNTSASFYQPEKRPMIWGTTHFPKWLVDDAKSQNKYMIWGTTRLWLRTPSYNNIPSGNQPWQWNMILYKWRFRSRKSSNYCGFPIAMMTTEGTFNQGNIKTVNFTPINCQFNFHTNTITQLSKC